MIFVTVGTHEQQFNRLLKAVDSLVVNGTIREPVYIQTGYSNCVLERCEHDRFMSSACMKDLMVKADVVITHGGPSSFIEAMAAGKCPVVVPRRSEYDEHVNDHQVDFVRFVAERQGGIVPCYDVAELPQRIEHARKLSRGETFKSHNAEFCEGLMKLIERL